MSAVTPEAIARQRAAIREWNKRNRARLYQTQRAWLKANPGKQSLYDRRWRSKNPEAARDKDRRREHRRKTDPAQAIHFRISRSVWTSLRGFRKHAPTFSLLGYSRAELMIQLERQFLPGMSWGNMGAWHIDHIRPVSSFIFSSPEDSQFKECWALTNLRPLWAVDNMKKGARREFLL